MWDHGGARSRAAKLMKNKTENHFSFMTKLLSTSFKATSIVHNTVKVDGFWKWCVKVFEFRGKEGPINEG